MTLRTQFQHLFEDAIPDDSTARVTDFIKQTDVLILTCTLALICLIIDLSLFPVSCVLFSLASFFLVLSPGSLFSSAALGGHSLISLLGWLSS